MGFQPIILATDALIYLLLALATVFALYARTQEPLRLPWRRVAQSKTAMGTMVVLAFYVLVGVLDTLHYHPQVENADAGKRVYSTEVLSLFDYLVEGMREQQEKTYSAPFSAYQFSKENIELPSGEQIRDYPRLKYGGAHLADPDKDRAADIAALTTLGMLKGAAGWLLVLLLVMLARPGRHRHLPSRLLSMFSGERDKPWHVAVWMLLLLMLLLGATLELSRGYHILGTDKVGQDVFYQALKSIRTGLVIGTLTTLVMLPAAILLGIMAGYFKGWIDDLIQYMYTTLNSIPGVLLIAAAVLMMQIYISNHADEFTDVTQRADLRLLFLCLILGVTSWTGLCRLLRGESLKLRELEYVQAAHAFGVGHFRILLRHVLPNVVHIVLITVVLDFSGLVLAEAVLSYINIGVDASTNSWGNMINSARLELAREPIVWWSLLAAFFFMFTLVLAANLFADVVRDAFDPRLRQQR